MNIITQFNVAEVFANDIVDGTEGICVSVWLQGCPHRCLGCHNPETWEFKKGKYSFDLDGIDNFIDTVIDLTNQNVDKNLSILGGEPLCSEGNNYILTCELVRRFKECYPERKVYIWTGYSLNELKERHAQRLDIYMISNKVYRMYNVLLDNVDYLITDRFDKSNLDLTIPLRGSTNQKIYTPKNYKFWLWNKYKYFSDITKKFVTNVNS